MPEYVEADQSTATLKETLDWIRSKAPLFATFKDAGCPDIELAFDWLEFKNCDQWSFQLRDNDNKIIEVRTFSPRTLEESSVRVRRNTENSDCPSALSTFVEVDTLGGQKSVYYKSGSSGLTSQESLAYVLIVDHENAERLAKAMKHAIRLCGSKKEPF